MPILQRREQASVWLSYAAFVLVGVSAAVGGVLLPAQIQDYGVDKTMIGATFLTGSLGFVLASAAAGPLIHRYGIRLALVAGAAAYVAAGLYTATRPPFLAFVIVQVVNGFGTGVLESVLNAHLAAFPDSTTLLNRLHAFFGVGALLGPVLASWMLGFTSWPMVWLVLAVLGIPLAVSFLTVFPRLAAVPVAPGPGPGPAAPGAEPVTPVTPAAKPAGGGLLAAALRERAVLLGAAMLAVYVGLEISVGNWGFTYLMAERGQHDRFAALTMSGYWLGLTAGRFLIRPISKRIGLTERGMIFACLGGITAASALVWLLPLSVAASVGFVLLGAFLGPIFPTTIAAASKVTVPRLVPTAIGVMNAGSVVGGAALPWLAGAVAQGVGVWTLLPYAVVLGLAQVAVWWRLAGRMTSA